jgi:hypothetical protein
MARVRAAAGKTAEAETLYQRAIASQEKQTPGRSPAALADALEGYGILLRQSGRGAEADQVQSRARRLREPPARSGP